MNKEVVRDVFTVPGEGGEHLFRSRTLALLVAAA